MRTSLLPAAAVTAALIAAAPAHAATFKVVAASHSSTSAKSTPDYTGTATAAWKLTRPTAGAPNRLTLQNAGGTPVGLGTVAVKGAFAAQATSRSGRCAFTAPTGDREHAAVAPDEVILTVGPAPGGGVLVTHSGVRASLANPYFGSECSTSVSGEPAVKETMSRRVSAKLLSRRRVTLRFTGATNAGGITYRWKTTFELVRR